MTSLESHVGGGSRLLAPDLARGSMLLVVALAHAPSYLDPRREGSDLSSLDRWVSGLSTSLVEGRGYPVFAFMFGYGVVRLAERYHGDARSLLRRRGACLLGLGAIHAGALWPGDILGAYGVLLLLGTPLMMRGRNRSLIVVAVASWAVVGLGGAVLALSPAAVTTAAWSPWAVGVRLTEWAPTLLMQPLGLLGAVLLGVIAGRQRWLEDAHTRTWALCITAVVGLTVAGLGGVPLALLRLRVWEPDDSATALAGAIHSMTGYGGIGYAAAAALLATRHQTGVVARAVSASGQMSLTCYLSQSVGLTIVMSPHLGRLGERLGPGGAAVVGLGVWALSVGAAGLAKRLGWHGPAEAVVRWLDGRSRR